MGLDVERAERRRLRAEGRGKRGGDEGEEVRDERDIYASVLSEVNEGTEEVEVEGVVARARDEPIGRVRNAHGGQHENDTHLTAPSVTWVSG